MRILVLDNDTSRLKDFCEKLIGHSVTTTMTATQTIQALTDNDFDVVSLDHDLGDQVMVDSGPGTGWEVAKWLSLNPDRRPQIVLIHSFNNKGAAAMQRLLPRSIYAPGLWLLSSEDLLKLLPVG